MRALASGDKTRFLPVPVFPGFRPGLSRVRVVSPESSALTCRNREISSSIWVRICDVFISRLYRNWCNVYSRSTVFLCLKAVMTVREMRRDVGSSFMDVQVACVSAVIRLWLGSDDWSSPSQESGACFRQGADFCLSSVISVCQPF
jgi:hypothetical protein